MIWFLILFMIQLEKKDTHIKYAEKGHNPSQGNQ